MNKVSVLTWLRLARIFQKVQNVSGKHLRQWNLSMGQFDVLAQVGANEGMTQQELAHALLVTKGNISQLLDKMEQTGLLVRRHEGGRTCRIYLTQAGWQLFDEVVVAQEALISTQFATLSALERLQLLGLLRKLDHALKV